VRWEITQAFIIEARICKILCVKNYELRFKPLQVIEVNLVDIFGTLDISVG